MKIIFLFSFFVSWFGMLNANASDFMDPFTPWLDTQMAVGRLLTYENADGRRIFVPIAFDQTFHCNEESGICALKLYNRLSAIELESLNSLKRGEEFPLPYRADLFSPWVSLKKQTLVGDFPVASKDFISLRNFALLENTYGQTYFRVDSQKAQALNTAYESRGLGSVEFEYQIKGVVKDFSIRTSKDDLRHFLDSIAKKHLTFTQLKTLVAQHLSLHSMGYTREDATTIVAFTLQSSTFHSSTRVEGEGDWILTETQTAKTLNCEASLPIKKDAVLSQKCEGSDEN